MARSGRAARSRLSVVLSLRTALAIQWQSQARFGCGPTSPNVKSFTAMKPLALFLGPMGMACILIGNAMAATLVVNTTADGTPGSLRERIQSAASGDTITFTITGAITLGSELLVAKNLTISGPGASTLAISGNGARR